ncbi:sigma-70 family RNA polymerase sigma factor [Paenibacillus soyae]|uniref:Sigma-70 family RNA polymerase sigma factor n=1 Tax=Paenibacillus soyae TaxID=2969249 RepID=A0A9X2S9Z7_9BACL|nr:sigma-70 family RNA polymerase sigma factor [Paenibacillus soyae]MCR2805686.1 sigma-70 family RNA polymerase sigma factor [Paenibacillus soyae]
MSKLTDVEFAHLLHHLQTSSDVTLIGNRTFKEAIEQVYAFARWYAIGKKYTDDFSKDDFDELVHEAITLTLENIATITDLKSAIKVNVRGAMGKYRTAFLEPYRPLLPDGGRPRRYIKSVTIDPRPEEDESRPDGNKGVQKGISSGYMEPHTELMFNEDMNDINTALASLKEVDRNIFIRDIILDQSQGEIGTALGHGSGNISKRKNRAIDKIHNQLKGTLQYYKF